MKSLIYFSHASRTMKDDELQSLLSHARSYNTSRGITGLLLYQAGYFLQALEGEDSAVLTLFEKIQRDTRHHTVTKLYDQDVSERSFQEWHMGFHIVVGKELEDIDGYSDVLADHVMTNEIDLANEMTFVTVSLFKQYVRAAEQGRTPSP